MSELTTESPPPVPEGDIPFNLDTLRRHLGQVILARRVLSEDLVLRQRLLEQSVYNVAVERMKRQAELFDQLGLPNKSLHSTDLRTWMWHWHQKLQARIEAEIQNLEVEERVIGEYLPISLGPGASYSHKISSPEAQTEGRHATHSFPSFAQTGEALAHHYP